VHSWQNKLQAELKQLAIVATNARIFAQAAADSGLGQRVVVIIPAFLILDAPAAN